MCEDSGGVQDPKIPPCQCPGPEKTDFYSILNLQTQK